MTTYETPELSFPSAPIEGDTKATVDLVANDPWADAEWQLFDRAVHWVADRDGGLVDPSRIRSYLSDAEGELFLNPRRLSAFYNRAVAQGLLEFSHWGINGDHKGRNAGRPARIYRLVAS